MLKQTKIAEILLKQNGQKQRLIIRHLQTFA
nr:MAG TPA: hypothetical protein [Caudoviricetes sp.]